MQPLLQKKEPFLFKDKFRKTPFDSLPIKEQAEVKNFFTTNLFNITKTRIDNYLTNLKMLFINFAGKWIQKQALPGQRLLRIMR